MAVKLNYLIVTYQDLAAVFLSQMKLFPAAG